MFLYLVIDTLHILFTVIWWIIVVQAILSWAVAFNLINTRSDFVSTVWSTLDRLTAPLYNPIRRTMPDFGALDLSPMVVLIALMVLDGPVLTYLRNLANTMA